MKNKRCIHCRRERGNHKALTLHCPVGERTRVGYVNFHARLTFAEKR